MILSGYKKSLSKEDVWDLEEEESCFELTNLLEKEWKQKSDDFIRIKHEKEEEEKQEEDKGHQEDVERLMLGVSLGNVSQTNLDPKVIIMKHEISEPSILKCLIKIFYPTFLAGTILKLVQDLLTFTGPMFLG